MVRLALVFLIFLESSLAFSHSPGCMFLCDVQDAPVNAASESAGHDASGELIPGPFLISRDPLLYSLASQKVVSKIRELERIIGEDPGAAPLQTVHNLS